MPNEVEMNGFLYSILKQQDLKNVDWEAVAKDRAITNGHAARMRFSRFKSAQEGRETKPRKPRVPRETSAPRGAKARAAVKKSKVEKEKKKEKKELATPPTTPIKSDRDNADRDNEMAVDSVPISGMERQLPLPTEPASFVIKAEPDQDMEQDVVQETAYIKSEPDMESETSLESADFGHTVDMLGQVNIAQYFHHVGVPSLTGEVVAPHMIVNRDMMTPNMSLSPCSPKSSGHRAIATPEVLTPIPVMGVEDRELFHRHYSNFPLLAQDLASGGGYGKGFGSFEEYMRGFKTVGGDERMDEDCEPVVKEEQRWDDEDD